MAATKTALPPPETNSLLRIDLGHPEAELAVSAASRVEGYEGADLVIAAPGFEGDLEAEVQGLPVLVRWTGPRGVFSLETQLVEVRRGSLTTWLVRPVGAVQISQRRNYVRAPLFTAIHLVPVTTEASRTTMGWLSDLSEGGLRARVDGVPLLADAVVEARFQLEEELVTLVGTVLRSGPVDKTTKTYEVVVLLEAGRHADRIRRVVLRQQLQARRGCDS
jgi:hypothetical protein